MKNILYINSSESCICNLVNCIDDGTARLYLDITSNLSLNPRLEIGSSTVNITTNPFRYEIPSSLWKGTGKLQFRIVDNSHTGDYFSITKVASADSTMTINQIDNFNYSLKIYVEPPTPEELQEQINDVTSKLTQTNVSLSTLGTKVDTIISKIYPVGAIYLSTSSANPSSYLGGTWVAWGSGRVPVGVNGSDSDFSSAEKTGGEKTHTLSTSELPSHTHKVPAHSHGLNSHTHSIPALSGTAASGGSHSHTFTYEVKKANAGTNQSISEPHSDGYSSATGSMTTSKHSGHTHDVTTKAGTTGSASGNTANSSELTSGSTGSGTAHNNLQPYITCYMWKRTA